MDTNQEKKHYFEFRLKSDVLRTMNRSQYKAIMRWLRACRNHIELQSRGVLVQHGNGVYIFPGLLTKQAGICLKFAGIDERR